MPENTLAVRARLDAAVDGLTVPAQFQRTAQAHPDLPAVRWKEGDEWAHVSYSEYANRVRGIALGMRSLFGLRRGDMVSLMMRNVAPFHWVDLGASHLGCTTVSIYNSLAPEQIAYIVGHSGARVAVVENRDFLERFLKVRSELPELEKIVLVEEDPDFAGHEDIVLLSEVEAAGVATSDSDFDGLWQAVEPGDLCTLIYTSGTTGQPKGVMLTHRNIAWTAASYREMSTREAGEGVVSYLPMAHIAERMTSHYLSIWDAQTISCCPDPTAILEYLVDVRPETFFAVPRVWEKAFYGLWLALEGETDETRKQFIEAALSAGHEMVAYAGKGEPAPEELVSRHGDLDALVLSQIRARIGLDRCKFPVSGAAPLAPEIVEFFHTIGVRIAEIYGLSECSGPATWNPPEGLIKVGTVGPALPGVEVELADDGEVMVRGGNVFAGYFGDEEKTAEALKPDGWLMTGDIGEFDEDRYLSIVDRKKELIITAGGKNIAPSNLEGSLKVQPLVDQAAVIGDRRPYLTALIVLDGQAARAWAEREGVTAGSVAELAQSPRLIEEIQRYVDEVNATVSRTEGIKTFRVLSEEWGPESDELTPTLKLKRRVISEKYSDLIEDMYTS